MKKNYLHRMSILFLMLLSFPFEAFSYYEDIINSENWISGEYEEYCHGLNAKRSDYSFKVDGICYWINDDSTVSVTYEYDVYYVVFYKHWFYFDFDPDPVSDDGDRKVGVKEKLDSTKENYNRVRNGSNDEWWWDYRGEEHMSTVADVYWCVDKMDVVDWCGGFTTESCNNIPETVTYEGITYTVNHIGDYALAAIPELGPDWPWKLQGQMKNDDFDASLTLPATICSIGSYVCQGRNYNEVTCLAPTPPHLGSLDINDQYAVQLYVPGFALKDYKDYEDYGWGGFENIFGIYDYDFVKDGIYYKIKGDEVVVTYGPFDESRTWNAIISNDVSHDGVNYNIAGIESYAFRNTDSLSTVYLPVMLQSIGDGVFTGCNLRSLFITGSGEWSAGCLQVETEKFFISSGVRKIEDLQVKPNDVYSFAVVPPICDENTFNDYSGTLHVPAASLAAYFTSPFWCNFANIVGDAVEPAAVSLNKDTVFVITNNGVNLAAEVTPQNASLKTIIWSSSDSSVASVENGDVVCDRVGECDIIARCGNEQAICHVIVVEPSEIKFDHDSLTLKLGDQVVLNVSILPEDAIYQTLTWSSSNSEIVSVENGQLTAVGIGECEVYVQCGNNRVPCHVSVIEPTITLSQENLILELAQNAELSAFIYPETDAYQVVTWHSTNDAIATVENGIVSAVGIGDCDIVATCYGIQAVCHVTVVETKIFISLDQHDVSILPNHMITLSPSMTPVSTDIKVSSSNPTVAAARVMNGLIQIVGIAEGTTLIKVTSDDGKAEPDSCEVTVYTQLGDLNCDGFINISDVSKLIDYLLGSQEPPLKIGNGDVNRDGIISISDVSVLIDFLLGSVDIHEETPDTKIITVNGVSFKMIEVKEGSFMMGATSEQDSVAYDRERPAHEVELSSYYIGETEVTQELWEAVMGGNPSRFTGNPKLPVETVTWNDCQEFIQQLNQLTGKNFRLPTEAEWERAARGGNNSKGYKYAGSDNLVDVAWYANIDGANTKEVATKSPNELGLYDMSGNVWEWCQDYYAYYNASGEKEVNPTGPESGTDRVYRGGSWNYNAVGCRVSHRNHATESHKLQNLGFRLAL